MRPILFNKNETAFDTYGLGELNVTKGTVTRERNGNYTLYAEIPVNDPMVSILQKEMKLKADAGLRTKNQTFEISRIVKDSSNIVKIYGQHISHKLEYMAIRNGTILNGTALNALSIWRGALIGDYRFDVWSDIWTDATTKLSIDKVTNARLALGGVEGSILDIWGGEYEFDNMTVRLHKQLGRTAPTVLEYGRNILSAETDETIEDAYTSVLPFATYTPEKPEGDTSDSQPDPITVTIPENYVDSKYKALYAHRRIKVIDFSSDFSTDSKKKNIPTADKLRKLATDYMERNAIGKPKINTKIEYVDLAKTLDYADRAWIEELELCDIVPIYYPQIGLTDETAKVTTITYDFVNERNASVEFGEIGTNVRATMQSGLAGKVDEIAKAQQNFENSLPNYLLNAQGNKVWYNRPDDTTEHKVGDIWFEKNGLYDRMYIWNGSMWEKRIDTEDVDKVKKEVDKQLEEANKLTAIEIEKANAKAQEALVKAGTIPDASKLSEQIKTLILNSPDLNQKVTESLNQTDSGVIYNKILQNVKNEFVEQKDIGPVLAGINQKISKQTIEFQKLTETNKLYERIIGTSETDAPDKLSRLVMSSEIFQTEVGKYVTDDNNLIVNSLTMDKNTLVNANRNGVNVSVNDGVFTIKADGLTSYNFSGFTLPIYVKKIYRGETYTLGFKYRIRYYPDSGFAFNIKNHGQNKILLYSDIGKDRPPLHEWQEFQKTFKVEEDFAFGEDANYPFYIYLAKNGWIEFKEPILVRGSNTGPYKPSQFDDAYKSVEATRTQMSLLAGSWSVRNINSAGDVLNSINLLANGTNRIDGRLTHITGQTVIDEAVIDSANLKKVSASKISGGEADFAKINVINFDAKNVTSGTFQGLIFRGGRIEGLDGKMNIDLQNGQYNVLTNDATIRRIDDTNSSQFISLKKSGFVAEKFRDSNAALMVFGTNHNKDPKEVERHDNDTFAGIRVWSGKGNGTTESLTEFIGDRVLIYNNGRYRSPWNFHGNTNDGNTYLLPMNQNNVKHFIGRGDFFLEGIYSKHFYMRGGIDVAEYLWDLLTCFGILKRHGTISGASSHIQGVLNKYGFK
jgi:phage minor structural protein, N-terminal domain protein|nr:MAG TPA: tail protein [Caudoviricetes sp.]